MKLTSIPNSLHTFILCILALFLAAPVAQARTKHHSSRATPTESSTRTQTSTSNTATTGKLDLNTASKSELEALPGVGSKIAGEIVKARPFRSVEDLKNVKGIGEAKFAKLRSRVVVGSAEPTGERRESTPQVLPGNRDQGENSRVSSHVKKDLAPNEVININTSSIEELKKLAGIGDAKARAIVDARPFSTPEDIMKVKGIKQGTYNKIKDHISVR